MVGGGWELAGDQTNNNNTQMIFFLQTQASYGLLPEVIVNKNIEPTPERIHALFL